MLEQGTIGNENGIQSWSNSVKKVHYVLITSVCFSDFFITFSQLILFVTRIHLVFVNGNPGS